MSHSMESVGSNDTTKEIREFHRSSPCECYGKALCDDVTDLGAPKFPGEDEISMLRSGKSSLINVPSQNKRMRTFEGDVSTSQTLERRTPQEELCRAPHVRAESNGVWVMRMMNHYDFPSDIKSTLAAKLLDNPSMFPLIVGFDEKTLLSFIRGVSDEGLFNTWYMEWTARNLS